MSDNYQQILSALRHEVDLGAGNVAAIDTCVNNLLKEGAKSFSKDVLMLLSDNAKRDEGMFSLIHAAESCDDKCYVSDLCAVLPTLLSTAPRWASIVLMRVLNNVNTQHELIRQLRNESPDIKDAFREMLGRINRVSPQFVSKTAPVVLALM